MLCARMPETPGSKTRKATIIRPEQVGTAGGRGARAAGGQGRQAGRWFVLWRASHPPLGERIDFANGYRPWEQGKPLRYGHLFAGGP
jgi:hypothetical protein